MTELAIHPQAPRVPVPLSQAASLLARVCDEIDEGRPLDAVCKATFANLKGELAKSTDQTIAFKRACDGLILAAKAAEDAWRAKRKQIEGVLERFRAEVKQVLEAEPGVPYSGKLGTLALKGNGGKAKLVTKFLVREDKVISNVVDPREVELFGVDPMFLEQVVVTRLKTDAVRAALAEGPLPWAELEKGRHVHGW